MVFIWATDSRGAADLTLLKIQQDHKFSRPSVQPKSSSSSKFGLARQQLELYNKRGFRHFLNSKGSIKSFQFEAVTTIIATAADGDGMKQCEMLSNRTSKNNRVTSPCKHFHAPTLTIAKLISYTYSCIYVQ